MVSMPFTLTAAWTEENRYAADGACEMLLSNTSASDLRWALSTGPAAPSITPLQAHLLRPGNSLSVPLAEGQTLWVAGGPPGSAVAEVFDQVTASANMLINRAELVSLAVATQRPDGEEVRAGAIGYVWSAGADAIPDMPGLLPSNVVMLEHFGALGDGVNDDTAAWTAAMDYLEGLGGGVLQLWPNRIYAMTNVDLASRVTVRGAGPGRGGLKALASSDGTLSWLRNRDAAADGQRICFYPELLHCDVDLTELPFKRWLSRVDGTPVTDPQADYVMGTGALASGISGVDLTAMVSDGAVTGVTINNGGTGWNGHPSYPYVPDTVPLTFSGDGVGANGYATISGGTITSVTITREGTGYTSAPSVTTMGGYASIDLLTDPVVDRRNPDYDDAGGGVFLEKTVGARIENVRFIGGRRRVIGEGGGLNTILRKLEFIDCGKDDGPFHCIWTQSIGNPTVPSNAFCDTENILVEDVTIEGAERSALGFMPTGGGTIRRLRASGCGEATIFIGGKANYNGGKILIEDSHIAHGYMTDIVSHAIEINGAPNVTIRNCLIEGSCEDAINAPGCLNLRVVDNVFRDNATALTKTGDGRIPYGPYSERFGYNRHTRPIAGEALHVPDMSVIILGTLGGQGCADIQFRGNRFEDGRAIHPDYLFSQTKSGGDFMSGSIDVTDNNMESLPLAMQLWNRDITNVFAGVMPLRIAHNRGHVSNAPVMMTAKLTATGAFSVRPGFRPSLVRVYAHTDAVNDLFASLGEFSWTPDGTRNDFSWCIASNGTGGLETRFMGEDVIRIVDQGATALCTVEFSSWLEDGFLLNTVALTQNCTLKLVCCP